MPKRKQKDAFLEQFEKSRKNVARWPKWMRDLVYVGVATFPQRKTKGSTGEPTL
jgi:hypothetical protein